MRIKEKRQTIEFVENMHRAHIEVREAVKRKNMTAVQNMMCDLQELAAYFAGVIENIEGEGCITVSYLAGYCETLFHMFSAIQAGGADPDKVYQQLEGELRKIQNSINNDIHVRKEIVFFPYKAAMWDSLESIYLKLKEDPDNDVYCVPIPYFEVIPGGKLGKMHYEGGEYPENIEICDWKSYKFEERNPDEIYIHNPYDNCNLVTSVHPRFYSGKLKKHTDKLVYVPYFVMGEFDINDRAVTEAKKHFCFCPGIVMADEVILESENVKKFYVREYKKAAKAHGLTGVHIDDKYLNEKFKGTGSPKYEKVRNTKKSELDIPEEWLKIIQKPDGNWKKIIFYNTGITALLQHGEKWVDKISDSMMVFKKNKDNVALLWRPHPLIENTLSSMRPGALEKFKEIKQQYKEEGWGIYDDTADLDRAVVMSDAYYGDGSSVTELFQKAEKPVMLQNVAILNEAGA